MLGTVEARSDRLVAHLRGLPGLRFIALFGSSAVGRATGESDVDLAISVDGDELPSFDEQLALAASLSELAGRDADLVVLEEASTILRREVARGGRLLWEREPGAFIRFQAATAWEYEDLVPVLEICRRGFLASLVRKGARDARR
jgi:predicted nucleotidyltransferase